ncbi:Growth-regulating factor 1 [Euphorbia peplus]|nr:Growth-regulating factor 1 [Euphorbia peplus]
MMTGTSLNLNSNKFPFTATQWQELEHQALIYKYMISGIPIPNDLLFNMKRTSCLDSSVPNKIYARQSPHVGWSCFQMGLGRKIDPEPGRCRRTDGKKWRCSKEAYPDSKYCERHMHRGKNRSRKPVEIGTQTTTTTTTLTSPNISSNTNHSSNLFNPSSLSLLSTDQTHQNQNQTHHHFQNQINYSTNYDNSHLNNHHFLTSSRSQDTSFSLSNTDYRNAYNGMKEDVDEHPFFSEQSGSMRSLSDDHSWQFTPLTMNSSSSSSSSNQRGVNEYPYLQLRSLSDRDHDHDHNHHATKQQKQYNNYVHGNYMKNERDEANQHQQKTVHRFFDEWPIKNKDSWLDLDDKSQNSTSVSTTSLSISIPSSSSHDFPNIFNSRTHHDG